MLQYCLAAWLVCCVALQAVLYKKSSWALHAARGLLPGVPLPPNPIPVALGYRESFCIHYKVLILIYKAIKEQGPSYLSELVTLYSAGHRLRSTDAGPCACSVWAAPLWVVALSAIVRVARAPGGTGAVTFPAVSIHRRDTAGLSSPWLMLVIVISEESLLTLFFQSFPFSVLRCVCETGTKKNVCLFSPTAIPFLFSVCRCNSPPWYSRKACIM